MGDAIPGSRHLLNILIKGSGNVTGLQVRLDTAFGPSLPNMPKAQPRYAYDPKERGLAIIAAPLARPLVTLMFNNRQRTQFFKNDKHPTITGFAWAWEYAMQIDVWARDPVEQAAVEDQVSNSFVVMASDYWDEFRIGIDIASTEDIAYEVDHGIYRSLIRGKVTTAMFAASGT